ncbi:MAG: radical SAM protein [Planctomycetaceae bacterium]|nr:radical SAM protein [Planctomycetaceae bacterium]
MNYLEMHISHTCNLACRFCSHYCDIGYTGIIPYEQGSEWITAWSKRLQPSTFRLLGGEPLLNPELDKYLELSTSCFPDSGRWVVTNGLLLRKIERLFPLFIKTSTKISLSIHPMSQAQERILNDAMVLLHQWKMRGLGFAIQSSGNTWTKKYHGEGPNILPYEDGDPDASWALCTEKICVTISDGRLYPCPPLAYLPLIADKLKNRDVWQPYLSYTPLEANYSDEDLSRFLQGSTHGFCAMCPSKGAKAVALEGHIPPNTFEELELYYEKELHYLPDAKSHRRKLRKMAVNCWEAGDYAAAVGCYISALWHKLL